VLLACCCSCCCCAGAWPAHATRVHARWGVPYYNSAFVGRGAARAVVRTLVINRA
jgi:hypothetical protein